LKSNQKTDLLEYAIRFVFGAVFGCFASFLLFRRSFIEVDLMTGVIASAVICGVLAAWMGDAFYRQFFS